MVDSRRGQGNPEKKIVVEVQEGAKNTVSLQVFINPALIEFYPTLDIVCIVVGSVVAESLCFCMADSLAPFIVVRISSFIIL